MRKVPRSGEEAGHFVFYYIYGRVGEGGLLIDLLERSGLVVSTLVLQSIEPLDAVIPSLLGLVLVLPHATYSPIFL
jgi:hypothetical protein